MSQNIERMPKAFAIAFLATFGGCVLCAGLAMAQNPSSIESGSVSGGEHAPTLRDLAAVWQSIVATVALVVGGYWTWMLFVVKRQKYPRANITQRVTHRRMNNDWYLIQVTVSISNTGDVLLSLESAEIRILRILPPPEDVVLEPLSRDGDPVADGKTEVEWPLANIRAAIRAPSWKTGEYEIEPGETDHDSYDFFVKADVGTVEVYTHYRNEKKRKREIGWDCTTLYDLAEPQSSEDTENEKNSEDNEAPT